MSDWVSWVNVCGVGLNCWEQLSGTVMITKNPNLKLKRLDTEKKLSGCFIVPKRLVTSLTLCLWSGNGQGKLRKRIRVLGHVPGVDKIRNDWKSLWRITISFLLFLLFA